MRRFSLVLSAFLLEVCLLGTLEGRTQGPDAKGEGDPKKLLELARREEAKEGRRLLKDMLKILAGQNFS